MKLLVKNGKVLLTCLTYLHFRTFQGKEIILERIVQLSNVLIDIYGEIYINYYAFDLVSSVNNDLL